MKLVSAAIGIALAVAGPSAHAQLQARPQAQLQDLPAAYAQALYAADMFLWAWATCDWEAGERLISPGLAERLDQDTTRAWSGFRQYMSGLSNPHHLAFEITGGKLLSPDRARFSVTLYDHYQGEPLASRYESVIELVHDPAAADKPDSLLRQRGRMTERLEWIVDVLPKTPYGP